MKNSVIFNSVAQSELIEVFYGMKIVWKAWVINSSRK